MSFEFEWDPKKADENLKKHEVAFAEAITVFGDPLARIFDDPDHSDDERREIIIGYSTKSRLLLVSFTERPARVRVISARKASKRERQAHEQAIRAEADET